MDPCLLGFVPTCVSKLTSDCLLLHVVQGYKDVTRLTDSTERCLVRLVLPCLVLRLIHHICWIWYVCLVVVAIWLEAAIHSRCHLMLVIFDWLLIFVIVFIWLT